MGQNIYWEPIQNNRSCLPTMAPSSFRGIIERVFGSLPVRLNDSELSKLEALREAITQENDSFTELIEAISRHGSIEISAE